MWKNVSEELLFRFFFLTRRSFSNASSASVVSCSSASVQRKLLRQPLTPLNTQRLDRRHIITKSDIVKFSTRRSFLPDESSFQMDILDDGEVVIQHLTEAKTGSKRIVDVFRVSADGQKVRSFARNFSVWNFVSFRSWRIDLIDVNTILTSRVKGLCLCLLSTNNTPSTLFRKRCTANIVAPGNSSTSFVRCVVKSSCTRTTANAVWWKHRSNSTWVSPLVFFPSLTRRNFQFTHSNGTKISINRKNLEEFDSPLEIKHVDPSGRITSIFNYEDSIELLNVPLDTKQMLQKAIKVSRERRSEEKRFLRFSIVNVV